MLRIIIHSQYRASLHELFTWLDIRIPRANWTKSNVFVAYELTTIILRKCTGQMSLVKKKNGINIVSAAKAHERKMKSM